MSDLNWCTYCDSAINSFSESLYCSEQCLRADALRNHPLLGYTYPEFVDFPRAATTTASTAISIPYTQQRSNYITANTSSCSSSIKSYSTVPSLSAASTSTTNSSTTTTHTPAKDGDSTPSPYLSNNNISNQLLSPFLSNVKDNINASTTTLITKTNTTGLFAKTPTTMTTTNHVFTSYFFCQNCT